MKLRHCQFVLSVVIGLMILGTTSGFGAEGPYKFIKEIPVGGDGGWDYASVDAAGRRLYVSHASKVVVIDLDQDKVVGEITETSGVHGIAIAPELNRAFVSCGRDNKVNVVDLKTLKTIKRVDTDKNPDAILFEPGKKEVYAFNGSSSSATVIDAATGNAVTTISLSGKPEFAAADPKVGRVYVNIEDKSEVAVIDTGKHEVVATWPIAPGEEASGMAFDPENHRLFLGCNNKLMVVMDSTNGKVLGTLPIGQGVDANAFDPANKFAFASNGDGTVTVAHEDSPDTCTVVQTLKTQRGSRTMTIDPTTHKIYLAAAEFEQPAQAPAPGQRQRPKMIPGTFKVMVYGIEEAAKK